MVLAALGVAALVAAGVLSYLMLTRPSLPTAAGQPAVAPSTATASPGPVATTPEATVSPTVPPAVGVDRRPARVLGAQWRRSGPASDRRSVEEVLALVIPLGCVQRSPLPPPERVVEDTFVHKRSGAAAVALRLTFATRAEARDFLVAREADLRACRDQPDDPYSGASAPVTGVSAKTVGVLVSERTDPYAAAKRATWTELFVRDARTVTGVAVNVSVANGRSVDLAGVTDRLAGG